MICSIAVANFRSSTWKSKDQPNPFAPVNLEIYKDAHKEQASSCSDALDKWFAATSDDVKEATSEKQRLANLAEKQKEQIAALKRKGEEYKKIGDLIYNHFDEIDQIIKDVKKSDWKTEHKLIKELNKKEKKIILELWLLNSTIL